MATASQIMQYLDHVAGAVTVPRDNFADALHRNASAHVSTRVDTFGFQYETTLDELAREEDAK